MALPMNATEIPPGIDLTADQGRRIIISNIVLLILPTIFVIGRFVSRQISHAGYWVCWIARRVPPLGCEKLLMMLRSSVG